MQRTAAVAGLDFIKKGSPCVRARARVDPNWPDWAETACDFWDSAVAALPTNVAAAVASKRWVGGVAPPTNLAQLVIDAAAGDVTELASVVGGDAAARSFAGNIFTDKQYDYLFGMWEKHLEVKFEDPEVRTLRQAMFANATDDLVERAVLALKTGGIGSLFKLGTNQFSVFTETERLKYFAGFDYDPVAETAMVQEQEGTLRRRALVETWPEVDWRDASKNPAGVVAVTAVKNQLSCGSCWSFATTGALEGRLAVQKGGVLVSLSEQHIVSCDTEGKDHGCQGGHYYHALKWTADNGMFYVHTERALARDLRFYVGLTPSAHTPPRTGVTVSRNEPYMNTDIPGQCDAALNKVQMNKKGSSSATYQAKTEQTLKEALMKQPVAVAVRSAHPGFGSYSGGVLNDPACLGAGDNVDHAVLAVGYGTDAELGLDYCTFSGVAERSRALPPPLSLMLLRSQGRSAR